MGKLTLFLQNNSLKAVVFGGLLLLLIAYHAQAVMRYGMAKIDGERYGRNLARGNGPVLSPDERVEGFTNPLWTGYMSVLHILPIPPRLIPFGIHVGNALLSLAIAGLLAFSFAGHHKLTWPGLIASGLYVAMPLHIVHAHEGFEVYLFSFIALLAILRRTPWTLSWALLVGLLPLSHGMGLPLLGILLLWLLFDTRYPISRRLLLCTVACFPFGLYELFRLNYYADILPNTYWLKSGAGSTGHGLRYVVRWVVSLWPLVVAGLFALLRSGDRRVHFACYVTVMYCAAVVWVGGDIFRQFRFMIPFSALLCWMSGVGADELVSRVRKRSAALAALIALILLGLLTVHLGRSARFAYGLSWPLQIARDWNIRRLLIGQAVARNTPPGSLVAFFPLGYHAYWADRPVIDMLGKADAHIARQRAQGRAPVGHNKTDFDYVVARKPFAIETSEYYVGPQMSDEAYLVPMRKRDPFDYVPRLIDHTGFKSFYCLHPVKDLAGRYLPLCTREPTVPWIVSERYFELLPDLPKLAASVDVDADEAEVLE